MSSKDQAALMTFLSLVLGIPLILTAVGAPLGIAIIVVGLARARRLRKQGRVGRPMNMDERAIIASWDDF